MPGYSGTPLPKKLGVKPGSRVAVVGAPREASAVVSEIEREAPIVTKLTGKEPFDVIVLFCRDGAALGAGFENARDRLAPDGGLWIAWPKKSSGIKTDLTEDGIRDVALPTGLVDNKVCAIDETWSGLRLVVRVENRKAHAAAQQQAPKTKGH